MMHSSWAAPCRGFAVALRFPDVEPEVLVREEAADPAGTLPVQGAWPDEGQRISHAMPIRMVSTVSGAPTTK